MSDESPVDGTIKFNAPTVAGHRFVDSSEGWKCEVCNRRWTDVVARQPTWPGYSRGNGEPVSQGIACVGNLNTPEEEQIEAVKTSAGRIIRIISLVPNTQFSVYDAANSGQMTDANLILQQGAVSIAGAYGVTPGTYGTGTATLPSGIIELHWPVVNGIAVSMPDNAGGPISVSFD